MTALPALWLPILVSAVIVFIASAIIHMLPLWHRKDLPALPNEEAFRAAVGPMAIPPGQYVVPRTANMQEMKSPEYVKKMNEGPVVLLTFVKTGTQGMGKPLSLWFVYSLVVSFFAAYITGRALEPGTDYLEVFRFAGATAFIGYTVALWQMSIWYWRPWKDSIVGTVDGLIYALLTAGVFGWLWPGA